MDLNYALQQAREMIEELNRFIEQIANSADFIRLGQTVSNLSTYQARLEYAVDQDDE